LQDLVPSFIHKQQPWTPPRYPLSFFSVLRFDPMDELIYQYGAPIEHWLHISGNWILYSHWFYKNPIRFCQKMNDRVSLHRNGSLLELAKLEMRALSDRRRCMLVGLHSI
jgi:hypothetical protein